MHVESRPNDKHRIYTINSSNRVEPLNKGHDGDNTDLAFFCPLLRGCPCYRNSRCKNTGRVTFRTSSSVPCREVYYTVSTIGGSTVLL